MVLQIRGQDTTILLNKPYKMKSSLGITHSGVVVWHLKMVQHRFIFPLPWTDSRCELGGCMVFRYSGNNHLKKNQSQGQ